MATMSDDEGTVFVKTDRVQSNESVRVDDFSLSADLIKEMDGLSTNFKRKIGRMNKVWEGQDGAKSKQLVPQQALNTAYGLMDVVIPPYNLDELAGFYDNHFANHASINAKVANIVGLGYGFETSYAGMEALENAESESARQKAQKRIEREKARLEDWLESLNDDDTFTHSLEKFWTDYEAVGNGYLEIGRTVNGEIGYVGHIPAVTMRVRRFRDGYVQIVNQNVVWFNNFQTKDRSYNPITSDTRPNEIIHLKKYTPKNTYYGVPDILSAAVALVGDQLAGKYNIDYFENKAVPRYIVTLKGAKLSTNGESELFRFLQAGLKGQNHRTLYIPLPGDSVDNKVEFKMEPIENGVQEGSFNVYHKSNRDDILMAHQMPISKVGSGAGISIAAALAADRTFKEQVARPSQRTFEKAINKIIKEQTNLLNFKLNELTLTDEQTQSQIDERYLKTQVVTPNEVRESRGLPARKGGDKVLDLSAKGANNARETQRANNATDSPGTATGRNPQGEGRSAP